MPPIHTKILHRFDMTLRVAKIIWAMQKKSRRKLSMPRSLGKRKKKKKNNPYFKIKDRVMQKEVRVPSRKIPHTCTSWSDCMICFLYWIRFLTLQYMQDMYASFHSLPRAPQKALLEIGRRETIYCFGEESYTLSDLRESFEEQSFILIFKNLSKTQVI